MISKLSTTTLLFSALAVAGCDSDLDVRGQESQPTTTVLLKSDFGQSGASLILAECGTETIQAACYEESNNSVTVDNDVIFEDCNSANGEARAIIVRQDGDKALIVASKKDFGDTVGSYEFKTDSQREAVVNTMRNLCIN